jgi:hypothetical protein
MLFPPISDSLPAKIQSTFGGKSPSISRQIIVRIPTDFHGALPAKSYYVELLDESSIFPPSSIFLSMATMNDAAGGWVAIVRAGLSISLRRTSLSLSLVLDLEEGGGVGAVGQQQRRRTSFGAHKPTTWCTCKCQERNNDCVGDITMMR